MEKLKGCTYKITHMSVASFPILKLKPRTNFYLSVFFFLFNVFLYIHEYANEIIVYSSLGQRAISQLSFGTKFGSPGYMAA